MDERLQSVARRLAGEPMAELCRELGQDWAQDLRSLSGIRGARADGSESPSNDLSLLRIGFSQTRFEKLLRATGAYPRVLEQEEQPGLISASRRRPRLNCR